MILNSPTISGSLTVTGNILTSGSITLSGSIASASYAATASFVALAQSASNAVSAETASFANAFTVAGNLTAQTLVVQTITSSVDFVTGSTRFGSILGNTHVFTGSMSVSGSANFRTSQNFIVSSSSTGWISGFVNDYNNTVFIGVDNDGMYSQPTSKGTKLVAGNGITYLYVTSSGVGIGTTSPTLALNVIGQVRAGYATNAGVTIGLTPGGIPNNDLSAYILWGDNATFGGENGDLIYVPRTSTTGAHRFYTGAFGVASEKMRITSGGDVGIGNTAFSSTRLTVTGKSNSSSDYSFVANNASNSNLFLIRNDGWCIINANKGAEALQVNNTRNSTGDYAMVTTLGSNCNNTSAYHYIAATGGADKYYLYGNGTYTTVSDVRLKKNITTVADTYLDKVKDLRVVNYNWNDQPDGSDLELGMIAQEVEELIPSIVYEGREHEDGNIYKGIQVSSLPYILIKAIQELKAQNDDLQSQINELKAQ